MPVERTAKTKRPSQRRSRASTACHRASSSITVGICSCRVVCSFSIDRSSITIIAHAGDGIYLDLALKLDTPGSARLLEQTIPALSSSSARWPGRKSRAESRGAPIDEIDADWLCYTCTIHLTVRGGTAWE